MLANIFVGGHTSERFDATVEGGVADTHLLCDEVYVEIGLKDVLENQVVEFVKKVFVALISRFLLGSLFRTTSLTSLTPGPIPTGEGSSYSFRCISALRVYTPLSRWRKATGRRALLGNGAGGEAGIESRESLVKLSS